MKTGMMGTFAAIPTPFKNGDMDEPGLRSVARYVKNGGVSGIVACGTTGEAPSLRGHEWRRAIEICLEEAGNLPVIVGAGSSSTEKTVEMVAEAKHIGAFAALVVTPYYVKPTPEGMRRHFEAVVAHADFRVILYNVPDRTGVDMDETTMEALATDNRVLGVKEARGARPDRTQQLVGVLPDGFSVLAGDDEKARDMYKKGARGAISASASVVPANMSAMYYYHYVSTVTPDPGLAAGYATAADDIHKKLSKKLFKALFKETNPGPIKYALWKMSYGALANELRMPLAPVTAATAAVVDDALLDVGLI
jgi:4-hydroxy-tetrahydrodipicolinate synthase